MKPDVALTASALTASALATVLAAAPLCAQEYGITIVEALDPSGSIPELYFWDINDLGRACGQSTYLPSYSGFFWDAPSTKTPLGTTRLNGINDLGQAVEANVVYDTHTSSIHALMPSLSGYYATLYAQHVNDNEVVVGWAKGPGSDSDGVNRTPFHWDPVNGTQGIPVPGAAEFLRVNDSNLAIGTIRSSASADRGLVYELDTGVWWNLSELLPPGPGASGPATSQAFDVNEAGQVAGKGWTGATMAAFVWSVSSGFTFLPGLKGGAQSDVHPRGIADDGTVVGYARDGSGEQSAFVWDPVNGMRDLNDLVVAGGGYECDRAMRINANGWIVGDGHYGPGFGLGVGFVLQPVTCQADIGFDGPGTLALSMCGDPLATGGEARLSVTGGPASSTLFLGYSAVFQPTFLAAVGATLVPGPPQTIFTVSIDASGSFEAAVSGGGGPLTLFAQAVALDPSLPTGFATSNALQVELLP